MCLKYPGVRYLMGRAKLTALKQSTLKTWFEVAKFFSLIEGEDYKYNQQNNIIIFSNGSEILLKDLFTYPSDPDFDSLGSIELTGAAIDEANQVSEKAKNVVMSRIRYKLDEYNLIPKLYMSCNPSKNWVYNSFYKPSKDGTIEDYRVFIQALVTDNEFISKHYVKNLEKLDDLSKKRLLYGMWEYADELSILNYDALINVFNDVETNMTAKMYGSIDVARLGKDKTCITIWKGFKIIEIIELSKKTGDIQTKEIKELQSKYSIPNRNLVFDVDGVGGFLKDNFPGAKEIINNSKALKGENYQNLKTQLYFKLAEKINKGEISCAVLNDDQQLRLTQELQVLKRENVDSDGKICMTSKDKVKQQIGRSPDISDSFAYRMIFEMGGATPDFAF